MKKIFLSSAVALSLAVNSFAETKLDDIFVTTATKTQKNIDGLSASIQVLTREDIEKTGAQSLKDIINKKSSLNIQYGTFPNASSKSKSSISIRGMSANGTLFLLDGRRLAGEVKNPYDLDRIPASIIERIEIVKGPMSSLYGADATGGIINIITKKPSKTPQIILDARYGQNKEGEAKNKNISLSLQGKKDKFEYSFYANKVLTDPYTQNEIANLRIGPKKIKPSTSPGMLPDNVPLMLKQLKDTYNHNVTYREDSDISTLGGSFNYIFSENTKLGFDLNWFKEEREGSYIGYFHPAKVMNKKIPVFNIPVKSKDNNKRLDLSLELEQNLKDDLTLKLKAYKSKYEKRNTTTAIYYKQMGYKTQEESASNGMNANVDVVSYEGNLIYSLNNSHLFVFGLEHRQEDREATVFSQGDGFEKREVNYKSAYLQDEWQINDKLSAILGARYDDISTADAKPTFKLGLTNKFSNLANLRVIFAQAYRAPDLRELYINRQTPNGLNQGSIVRGYNLKPEFTNTYEVGLGGSSNNFSYDVALFLNDIKDRIQETKIAGNINTFVNIHKAQTKGLELNLSYDILNNLSTNFNYTYLKTEDKNTKKDLEFNPEHIANLSFSYEPMKELIISPSLKYVGEQYYKENNAYKKTKSYTLVDLNFDYAINKNINLYGGLDNIFNKKVDNILGSNVGIFYFAGLKARF